MNDKELIITSTQNERIKSAAQLWNRRHREATDLFLIEGYRELLRAADNNVSIHTLFYCPELFLGSNECMLIKRLQLKGVQTIQCSEPVFRKLSYRDRPDGLIGVAPQHHKTLIDIEPLLNKASSPFLVVAEAIEKPGNLGTILRTCDAVGVDACIVCDRCTDIHNPNVVRASVGTLFTVPVVESNSEETLAWLKSHHISIIAATPSAKEEFTHIDMTQGIAIAVGTEQIGLSKKWMEASNIRVRIPMMGSADSLNVAMATTLLLYEALRQRSQ